MERGQPRRVDAVAHGAGIETEPPCGLAIAPRPRVDPRAVVPEERVGAEGACLDRRQKLGAPVAVAGSLRLVGPANHQIPDALLELPHVAGPGVLRPEVRGDPGLGFRGDVVRLLVARDAAGDRAAERAELARRVPEPLGEGRRDQEVGAEAVVEVLPEAAGGERLAEIPVRGGDELPPECPVGRVAQALERPRLEDAQELHLDRRVDLADLVEEDRAERRARLEPALPVLEGPGEGAAPVAEELRLDEGGGEGREVQGEERARRRLGEGLGLLVERDVPGQADGPGDELLAGARRAGDEGGDVAHPRVEGAPVAPPVAREDRLPDGRAEPPRRPRLAEDVRVDVVEGAPDLVEAGEDVGGLRAEWARAPPDVEVVREVAPDALEEGYAARRLGPAAEPLEERALVALVERVEDEVLVEPDVLGARPGAVCEARAGRIRERRRARRDPDDVRRRLRLRRGVPERPGRVEGVAEGRALGLEALGEEGVAGAQPTHRPRHGRVALGEEHRGASWLRPGDRARVPRRVSPDAAVCLGIPDIPCGSTRTGCWSPSGPAGGGPGHTWTELPDLTSTYDGHWPMAPTLLCPGRGLPNTGSAGRVGVAPLPGFEGLVGRSAAMAALFDRTRRVAPYDVPVLILGETGTGKELVAAAVHRLSRRRRARFEAVNCGALTRELLRSELFGHERGAFTGALERRAGLLREADGGTVFLDEVAELAPDAQAMLLRFLGEGEVRAVGASHAGHVDVRLIAATHRDLRAAVAAGGFREDLYYRLRRVVLDGPAAPRAARGPAAARRIPPPAADGAPRHRDRRRN